MSPAIPTSSGEMGAGREHSAPGADSDSVCEREPVDVSVCSQHARSGGLYDRAHARAHKFQQTRMNGTSTHPLAIVAWTHPHAFAYARRTHKRAHTTCTCRTTPHSGVSEYASAHGACPSRRTRRTHALHTHTHAHALVCLQTPFPPTP